MAFNSFTMLKNKYKKIVDQLPYKSSFLFVDNISLLNDDEVTGDYTLKKDAFFYESSMPARDHNFFVNLTKAQEKSIKHRH